MSLENAFLVEKFGIEVAIVFFFIDSVVVGNFPKSLKAEFFIEADRCLVLNDHVKVRRFANWLEQIGVDFGSMKFFVHVLILFIHLYWIWFGRSVTTPRIGRGYNLVL